MYTAPTAAASVGVKIPPRMPPMMMTGVSIAAAACRKVRARRAQEKDSLRRSSRLRAHGRTMPASAAARRNAGVAEAANSAPTDTVATEAYTMAGMLGGMSGAMTVEAADRPTEK